MILAMAVALGLLAMACGESTPSPTPTATTVPPPTIESARASIRQDNPLVAEVTVALDREARVYVLYENDAAGKFRTMTTGSSGTEHVVPVVRLRPSTTYTYQALAVDSEGRESAGAAGEFTTGRLPEALATIEFKAQGKPTPELILMDYRDQASSYIIVLDNDSEIVWYYANPNPFDPMVSGLQAIRQKPNFNLVFYIGTPSAPCCLKEITPLGDQVDQLVFSEIDQTPHHDHLVLSDDQIMYLADVTRVIDDTANGGDSETGVTGDAIRIWDQGSGTTQEVWSSFDAWDVGSAEQRVVWSEDRDPKRWTHFNSLQIGAHGNIIISSRNRNQVLSIAPDFQSIEWQLNGPSSSFTFSDASDRFYRQHTATELPNGNILVFDNGQGRPEEEGGEYSRALELALNDYDLAATKVWEYRPDPDIYASFISSAYRLDNGNTLINFGTTPDVVTIPITVVEVDRQGNEVWNLQMTGPTLKNRYRAYPLESIMGERVVP